MKKKQIALIIVIIFFGGLALSYLSVALYISIYVNLLFGLALAVVPLLFALFSWAVNVLENE